MERFSLLEEAVGTQREGTILKEIYEVMPEHNFSSDLLGKVLELVGAIEMQDVLWSDWGRPERILDTLKEIGREPFFHNGNMSSYDLTHHPSRKKIRAHHMVGSHMSFTHKN